MNPLQSNFREPNVYLNTRTRIYTNVTKFYDSCFGIKYYLLQMMLLMSNILTFVKFP